MASLPSRGLVNKKITACLKRYIVSLVSKSTLSHSEEERESRKERESKRNRQRVGEGERGRERVIDIHI